MRAKIKLKEDTIRLVKEISQGDPELRWSLVKLINWVIGDVITTLPEDLSYKNVEDMLEENNNERPDIS